MSDNTKDFSIIIPTFNEKDNIKNLVDSIYNVVKDLGKNFEVIVVDDDSPDKTFEILTELSKKYSWLKPILRKDNHGLGLSIKQGMQNAKGKYVIGMDADFNHDPKILPEILKNLESNDLVVASRFAKGGGMDEKYRYYPTLLINSFFKLLGMPILDNTSGYYGIELEKLLKLGLDKIYYGYGDYHLRLVFYAKKSGLSIIEIPVYYRKRVAGQTKSKLLKMLKDYTFEIIRLNCSA